MTDSKNTETVDPVQKFNASIKQLFEIFEGLKSSKLGTGLAIGEAKKEMLRAMSATPEYVVTSVSAHILNQGERIMKGESKWFLEHNYSSAIMTLSMTHKLPYTDCLKAIEFMKAAFISASAEKQKEIVVLVQQILGFTAKYLQSRRKGG